MISGPTRISPVWPSTVTTTTTTPSFGQEAPVPEDTVADVADDAVHVEVAGRHVLGDLEPVGGELERVAVLAQEDAIVRHPHLLGRGGRWP